MVFDSNQFIGLSIRCHTLCPNPNPNLQSPTPLNRLPLSTDPDPKVQQMVAELHRVLRPGGRYLQITFGQPHMRRRYFEPLRYRGADPPDARWALELSTVGDGGFVQYYCYCWTKL